MNKEKTVTEILNNLNKSLPSIKEFIDNYGKNKDYLEERIEYYKENIKNFESIKKQVEILPKDAPLEIKNLHELCLKLSKACIETNTFQIKDILLYMKEREFYRDFAEIILKNVEYAKSTKGVKENEGVKS